MKSTTRGTSAARGMSQGTMVAVGLGAVVVAGLAIAAVALAGDSSPATKSPGVGGAADRGFTAGLAGGGGGTGLRVGLGCSLVIEDLAKARGAAFRIGRDAKGLEAARRTLYNFGDCGVTPASPLKVERAQARDFYLVQYELLRGAVAAGYLLRAMAKTQINAMLMVLTLDGISTAGLPTEVA